MHSQDTKAKLSVEDTMRLPMLGARRSWLDALRFWRRPDPYHRWRGHVAAPPRPATNDYLEFGGTATVAYYADLRDGG